ncbi:hypothetical protein LCGC14_1261820 [marine sediment metagenome]|uniref:Nuclease associated modular domain-containing protein n=1 Tax=marine sediment metagenome TaxID=412755 RepID=A0A0F9P3S7_9ZZZZ
MKLIPSGVYERTKPPWNKGISMSEEQKINIGKYVRTEKHKQAISEAQKIAMNRPEVKKKCSEAHKLLIGEKNPNWKGGITIYQIVHRRVRKIKLKPEVCEICNQKADKNGKLKLELSNIKDHQYTDNPDDYQYAHHSCHIKCDVNKKKRKRINEC